MSCNIFFVGIFGFVTVVMTSCTSETYEASGPPLPATPIITDSIIVAGVYSIAGQTWIIDRYRIGQFGELSEASDTVLFSTSNVMDFNGVVSEYSFYPSSYVYVLTMYQTPWGVLAGRVNPYNLEEGEILGIPFSSITSGDDQLNVYIWMHRL